MKLISWNVNGLRAVHKKGFNEFFAQQQPDVLCLQEIKIQDHQLTEELTPPATHQRCCTYAEKKGYSGVATYIQNSLAPEANSHLHGIGVEAFDLEGRFLISRIGDLLLYNIYIPSGTTGEQRQDVKYDFLDAFIKHLRSLSSEDRARLVICGDFNICHKEFDIHHPETAEKRSLSGYLPDERRWMDTFVAEGFVDSFRLLHPDARDEYSWWSYRAGARQKNLGWRIDYFFVSEALTTRVADAGIMPETPGSDHCPIYLELRT